jgi:hypothetical protein
VTVPSDPKSRLVPMQRQEPSLARIVYKLNTQTWYLVKKGVLYNISSDTVMYAVSKGFTIEVR